MVGLYQILAVNVMHNCYRLGTTTKLPMPFQVPGFWLERNNILNLRSKINIIKVQKQENKNINVVHLLHKNFKNAKTYRAGMPKSMRTR